MTALYSAFFSVFICVFSEKCCAFFCRKSGGLPRRKISLMNINREGISPKTQKRPPGNNSREPNYICRSVGNALKSRKKERTVILSKLRFFFGAREENRTPTSVDTRPSNVPVYQFQHSRISADATVPFKTVRISLASATFKACVIIAE